MPADAALRPGDESEGRAADGVRRGAGTSTASNPTTGAALRPFDNVGVQYGLNALNSGAITTAQFLDLNETDRRLRSGRQLRRRAHRRRRRRDQARLSGRPDARRERRADVDSDLRQRDVERRPAAITTAGSTSRCASALRQANGGNSDNMVMWRSVIGDAGREAVRSMDGRVQGRHVERSAAREGAAQRSRRKRVDGCYDKSTPPAFIAETLSFTSQPTSKCSELYPVYSNPRQRSRRPAGRQRAEVPAEAGGREGLQGAVQRRPRWRD